MNILTGDLWAKHTQGHWICVTTNGDVRTRDGKAVMGRGIALQAVRHYPALAHELGQRLTQAGNHVQILERYRLISFPVKWHWHEPARLMLIKASLLELIAFCRHPASILRQDGAIFMPKPGCGNGGLSWIVVKRLIEPVIDKYNRQYPHAQLVIMDR